MSEVIYKKCPNCGATMVRDESKVLTSIPPQYQYICPKCGQIEYDTYPPRIPQVVNDLFDKNTRVPNEWELFRREAAKDIVCSMIQGNESYDTLYVIHHAVEMADELIKQLKDESTR